METFFLKISWQDVGAFGMMLSFVFAVLWLYRSKGNKGQESKSDNKAADSKEKQLGELQDLLYKHLQTRVYLDKVDGEGKKYKEYNEDNDKEYIQALKEAINELKYSKK